MLLDDNSIEINTEIPTDLKLKVTKEYNLWREETVKKEYIRILRKVATLLAQFARQGSTPTKEPSFDKVLNLILQTNDFLLQHIYSSTEELKDHLILSILILRDINTLAKEGEVGSMSTVIAETTEVYKERDNCNYNEKT